MLDWKIGVEIELMAPKGGSRRDLANAIAQHYRGTFHPFFHPQSEASKVPGKTLFHNLTSGFQAVDSNSNMIAQCVDDFTLQRDFDKKCPPKPGWYRIVSDDSRLLHLIIQQSDPSASMTGVLSPIAELFGTSLEIEQMVKVVDATGASVAIAAPLPGERERSCELITAPMNTHHFERLDTLLKIAKNLGFTAPHEGATHIHFDASSLHLVPYLVNLTHLLWTFGDDLKKLFNTNPHCCRLGRWSKEMYEFIQYPDFLNLSWEKATKRLTQFKPTKYCDFNIKNLIEANRNKHTFEVRIFPVWLDAQRIINATELFVAIMNWAMVSYKRELPNQFDRLLDELSVSVIPEKSKF